MTKNNLLLIAIYSIFITLFITACGTSPVDVVDVVDEIIADDIITEEPVAEEPVVTAKPAQTEKPVATAEPKTEAPSATLAPQSTAVPIVNTVQLSIYGETEMLNQTVELIDGENAAAMVKRIAEESGIAIKIRGSGKFSYIVSIGDLAEFDRGPESGWTYYVNGEYMMSGAGNVTPVAGDVIEWKYKF